MTDSTDSYNVTAKADQAHDDKWLADQVTMVLGASLAVTSNMPLQSEFHYRLIGQIGSHFEWRSAEQFIRDWRVCGALMERCRHRMMWADLQPGGEESLPRSIIETCVEALMRIGEHDSGPANNCELRQDEIQDR